MMKKISRLSFKQIQFLLWLLVFGLNFFYVFQTDDSLWWAFFNSLANVCFSALIVYGNALWLMPAFYKKKKLMLYCTLSLFLIVSVTFARTQLVALVWCYIKRGTQEFLKYGNNNGPQFKVYVSIFLSTVMVYIFSIAFRYVLDFFTIRQQQETLKKQHAEAQLNLLKAQVQPHFLFNTLNNIYYTAQEESPLTAELIERLSSIMRYFLEEGPRKYIFLNTELDFIKNYIALEKIRMRFPLKVSENVVNVDTGRDFFHPNEITNEIQAKIKEEAYMFVKSGKQLVKISNEEILFFEAQKEYVMIHTTGKKVMIYKRMKDLAEQIPSCFIRVHYSYIININFIDKIEGNSIIIGNHSIPIGFSYKEDFLLKIKQKTL